MSSIRIPTSFNIDLEFEIPEFHRRLLAWIIDLAIIVTYLWLMEKVVVFFRVADDENRRLLEGIGFVPSLLYFVVSEILTNGQSVGKKIIGIRVINMNGGKPSLGQYIIRWLLRPIDFIGTLFMGGLLSVAFSRYSQRLGDMAAGTLLISTNGKVALNETIFMETNQNYVPQFPQVMRLSDRDLNTIRSLLERAKGSDNFNIAATASEKIKSVLKIDSPLAPFEFLETLLKDYNYISVQ